MEYYGGAAKEKCSTLCQIGGKKDEERQSNTEEANDRMSRRDELYRHGVNKLKLYQLGYYLELEEVEAFEDNDQYLKAAITLFNEIIGDTNYFLYNPSPDIFEDKKERYLKKVKELEEKRKKGEKDRFHSSKFFEEHELSEEERIIVLLLLTKRGVGISPRSICLEGETLIHALKLILDTAPEESRKLLTDDSKLMEDNIIELGGYKSDPISRAKRKDRGRSSEVERSEFLLSAGAANAILGAGEFDMEEEPSERGSRRDKKMKENLMEKIDPDVSFSEVILPKELKDSILSLLAQESSKDKFLEEWNMKSVIGKREGINLLFSGPPGTGKTMMAKAIGNRLEKEVYKVSMGDMVNVWYGESEKNVTRMFELVEEKDGVVLLDEAEGLLKHRIGGRSSTDATENRMVNLILQKLEDHSGIIIMTSNLAKSIDPGLERRMDLKVRFPMPEMEARKKIWEYHLPDELPLAEDVDIDRLAKKYDFPGGKIRNAVVNAARSSLMNDEERVTQEDLDTACKREIDGEKAMDYYVGEKKKDDSRRYA